MAIYHCNIKIIGRSNGKSAIASSAYRSGEKLVDKETGFVHDYTRKSGVIYNEVTLCKNAPQEYQNREVLWNEVQKIEKASNGQLAREIQVALPIEFNLEQQKEIIREYVQQNFVDVGMCADWAIHDKGDGNPHAHILLTTRPIKENGNWGTKERKSYVLDQNGKRIPILDELTGLQKVDGHNRKQWKRETIQANHWNNPNNAEQWREAWANLCNRYLSQEQQIDHRSYIRQKISQEPTIHEGYVARKIEAAGGISERCQENREIRERNKQLSLLQERLFDITTELKECAWDKIAKNTPEKPVQTFCRSKVNYYSEQEKCSQKPPEADLERNQQEDRLKMELERLNFECRIANEQVQRILNDKSTWQKEADQYLCKSEKGQLAASYYRNIESEIWQTYEHTIFKSRFKNHPDYYKIQDVLNIKKWFKEQKIEIPSKEALKRSENQFAEKLAEWEQKVKNAISYRDRLDTEKTAIEQKIHQINKSNPITEQERNQRAFAYYKKNHQGIDPKQISQAYRNYQKQHQNIDPERLQAAFQNYLQKQQGFSVELTKTHFKNQAKSPNNFEK